MNQQVRSRTATFIAGSVASLLMLCAPAAAASDYPNHPIRLFVPGTAGGGMDVMARLVADTLSRSLKQPIVVENKPGAAGNIAVNQLAKSPPDGYTIVLGQTSQLTINPWLYANLQYDPAKDFAPVVLLSEAPNVIVVSAKSPIKSLADLLQAAKNAPDGLDYATPGIGTVSHLTAELLQKTTGVKFRHIPYKGAGSALMDVVAERIPVMLSSIPTSLSLIRSGELRAIAVSALTRSPVLPDVPTIAEQGYPGFDAGTWYGLLMPAGTPKDIVQKVNEVANAALKSPKITESILAEGGIVLGGTSEEFTERLRTDNEKWSKIVTEAGVKMN